MASRIVVFGATGYTGRLVAERLAGQGERPVLAGRSEERLAELSERLGGLEYVKADAMRPASPRSSGACSASSRARPSATARRCGAGAGTRESLIGATLDDGHAFRDGRVKLVRAAERVRTFRVEGNDRTAISVGGAEHFGLPAAYGSLLEVNVYLGWFGRLAKPLQVGSLAMRVPGVRGVLQSVGERLVSLAGAPEAGITPDTLSWVPAIAYDASGEVLAEVHVTGADAYDFTASFLAWAAPPRGGAGCRGRGRARAGVGVRARRARGGLRGRRAATRRPGSVKLRHRGRRSDLAGRVTRSWTE